MAVDDAPLADPAPLRHFRTRSGYRYVYRTGPGERYAAQIRLQKRLHHLGAERSPQAAAARAAGFLARRYGPSWPAVHRAARAAAEVLKNARLPPPPPGRPLALFSRKRRLWTLIATVGPDPVVIAPPGAVGFKTDADAYAYFARHLTT